MIHTSSYIKPTAPSLLIPLSLGVSVSTEADRERERDLDGLRRRSPARSWRPLPTLAGAGARPLLCSMVLLRLVLEPLLQALRLGTDPLLRRPWQGSMVEACDLESERVVGDRRWPTVEDLHTEVQPWWRDPPCPVPVRSVELCVELR